MSDHATTSDDQKLDPQFVVRSSKSKLKEKKSTEKARKQSSKVLRLATHSDLPHHASAQSRSIIDFTKAMLGCSSTSFKLPPPPSTEELRDWEDWLGNRQAAASAAIQEQSSKLQAKNDSERAMVIRNHSKELKSAIPPTKYTPAPTISSKIPTAFQTTCHNEFKERGFPRITFDWTKCNLNTSDWNSVTADILALNWNKIHLNNRTSSKKTDEKVNVRGVIERWLATMKKKYAKECMKAEEVDEDEQRENESYRRHKQQRKKIARTRYDTAISVFPEKPAICVMFRDTDIVSDYEDSENIDEAPVSITPSWRSQVLNELIIHLDAAAIQLAKPKSRISLRTLLARQYYRNATDEENNTYTIPDNLPQEAYSEEILADLTILERRAMGIQDTEENSTPSLAQALEELKQLTTRTSLTHAGCSAMET